jgi:hypothetical protein
MAVIKKWELRREFRRLNVVSAFCRKNKGLNQPIFREKGKKLQANAIFGR